MKLQAQKRDGKQKSEINSIRRAGDIPAVFYSPGHPSVSISVNGRDFEAILRQITAGHLPTTRFTIQLDGKEHQAILKDIQYDITSYRVIHLDFEELHKDVPVNIKVPIECTHVAECHGIKLGGFLRQVMRHAQVRCLPEKIPSQFYVDVQHLGIRQSKRLSDLAIPEGVTLLDSVEQVAVLIAKR